jgi:Sec-independent protein secretion pathway component TatC
MTLLLVPLLALYEVSILVLRVVERHPSHADGD